MKRPVVPDIIDAISWKRWTIILVEIFHFTCRCIVKTSKDRKTRVQKSALLAIVVEIQHGYVM